MAIHPSHHVTGVLLAATLATQVAGCALAIPLLIAGGDEFHEERNGQQSGLHGEGNQATAASQPLLNDNTVPSTSTNVDPATIKPGIVVKFGGQVFQEFDEASCRAFTGRNLTYSQFGQYGVEISGDASRESLERDLILPSFRLRLYFSQGNDNNSKRGMTGGDVASLTIVVKSIDNVALVRKNAGDKITERSGVHTVTSVQHIDYDVATGGKAVTEVFESQDRLKMVVSIKNARIFESETLEFIPGQQAKSIEKKVSDKNVDIEIDIPFESSAPE